MQVLVRVTADKALLYNLYVEGLKHGIFVRPRSTKRFAAKRADSDSDEKCPVSWRAESCVANFSATFTGDIEIFPIRITLISPNAWRLSIALAAMDDLKELP